MMNYLLYASAQSVGAQDRQTDRDTQQQRFAMVWWSPSFLSFIYIVPNMKTQTWSRDDDYLPLGAGP